MSRSNSTKVSSRFFNSNNHSLPVTYYNKFTTTRLTGYAGAGGAQTGFRPDSRNIVYPPTNSYYWKGSVRLDNDSDNNLDKQKFAAWWPVQTLENEYLVLRWTSITTKDYKFDSTLTKTRVATKNSAEISQWHYPKMVEPGFSYAVWGRELPNTLRSSKSVSWTKYGVIRDKPGGVMEFVFNDKKRKLDDIPCDVGLQSQRDPFQWMITIENSNYEPAPTYGFGTGNFIPTSYCEGEASPGPGGFPIFDYAKEEYFGYSQWVVAMSPWRRNAPVNGYTYAGKWSTISYRVNLQWGGWEDLNVVLTNREIDSGDTPGGLTPEVLTYDYTNDDAFVYVVGNKNSQWDNSVTQEDLDWLEDVLNFAGREINTKYAFKGFNGESISALHHLDTSDDDDFTGMFQGAVNFNQDISFLDFSSADTMENMFDGANKYMQDMSGWNTPL